jgi:hypothetical protein
MHCSNGGTFGGAACFGGVFFSDAAGFGGGAAGFGFFGFSFHGVLRFDFVFVSCM